MGVTFLMIMAWLWSGENEELYIPDNGDLICSITSILNSSGTAHLQSDGIQKCNERKLNGKEQNGVGTQ